MWQPFHGKWGGAAVLLIALRDLQWRRRRFLIAVLATSLVFALTLLLSGAGNGLRNEASRTVRAFDADAWFVAEGASGPFTTSSLLPESTAEDVAGLDGVEQADPFLFMRSTSDPSNPTDVNVIGFRAGGLGTPEADEGKAPSRRGQALVDAGLGADVGEQIEIGGRDLPRVGRGRRHQLQLRRRHRLRPARGRPGHGLRAVSRSPPSIVTRGAPTRHA